MRAQAPGSNGRRSGLGCARLGAVDHHPEASWGQGQAEDPVRHGHLGSARKRHRLLPNRAVRQYRAVDNHVVARAGRVVAPRSKVRVHRIRVGPDGVGALVPNRELVVDVL